VVTTGESVTLTLFSGDSSAAIPHQFCVDYDIPPDYVLNGCDTPQEVATRSPFFNSASPVTYTFTASSIPGNYTYFCTVHTTDMQGKFVVSSPHDVAVTGLTTSRNFAYNSVVSNPVQVNVTASNLGGSSETFFVSAKANSTLIGNQSITLIAGGTTKVSFNWTTLGLVRGNYLLTAQATKVTGETNTANNSFLSSGSFNVKFRGDVSGDCKVDIVDLSTVGGTFGKALGQTGYNAAADLNNDAITNIVDLVVVAGNFGQGC